MASTPGTGKPAGVDAAVVPEAAAPEVGGPGGGGPGGRGRGRGRGRGTPDVDSGGIEDVLVKLYRCATVVKGGRRFSFGALTVVGDRKRPRWPRVR